MPTFFSPLGNPEVWEEKPEGYFTVEQWAAAHPLPEPEIEFNPGADYEQRDGAWWRVRFTKKEFLLLCGIQQVAALNMARKDNVMAETIYTLLMAAEYIDVTDPDTIQMAELLTSDAAGRVLTAEQAANILQGVKHEQTDEAV